MQINTTSRHFQLEPEDRHFAHSRLERFSRYAADLKEVHLVVTAESYRYVAEATLRLKQRELAVREEATDPRRAIELVADRAEQQLRRLHDKRVDHNRTPRVNGTAGTAPPAGPEGDDEPLDAGYVGDAGED